MPSIQWCAARLASTHAVEPQPRPITDDQLDDRAERQFAAADPPRLQDAEQAALVQIGDRLVGQPAQFLGSRRALAQDRHQRLGARRQFGESGDPGRPVFASAISTPLLLRARKSTRPAPGYQMSAGILNDAALLHRRAAV